MKKALALVLAIVLVLGLSTVALAKSRTDEIKIDEDNVYTYNSSSRKMSLVSGETLAPGETYYFWMQNVDEAYAKDDSRIKSTSALENYRLSYSIIDGKKAISSVGMVVKDINRDGIDGATMPGGSSIQKGKYAFIAVTTKENYSSESIDVDIEIKPTAKGSNSHIVDKNGNEEKNMSFNFLYSIGYEVLSIGSFTTVDERTPVVNFDDITDTEDVELYFGDNVEFYVNAKGQKELFLKYTDDPTGTKMDLTEKYPDANVEYHIFHGNNKTFRRTGTLVIKASSVGENKAPYVYEMDTSGKVTQVKPKYDNGEEQFSIQTTTLKNYVISDTPLKATASSSEDEDEDDEEEEESSSSSSSSTPAPTPPPVKPSEGDNDNPATGANDFMGLAVALTVVSFAAIGVASRKRNK